MSTKTFKVGEYGRCPKYQLTTREGWVQVREFNWEGKVAGVREFSMNDLTAFEMYMWEEATSYHADKMVEWIKGTKEFIPQKKDPFTTYTFSL
jgi:hypothetical protein